MNTQSVNNCCQCASGCHQNTIIPDAITCDCSDSCNNRTYAQALYDVSHPDYNPYLDDDSEQDVLFHDCKEGQGCEFLDQTTVNRSCESHTRFGAPIVRLNEPHSINCKYDDKTRP